MATGFYDANGIWNYGESDNIAPFSDTLNKLADSTSDAFTTDRARLATLEAGSLAGLIPVVPTSIVVATGTAAANDLGFVTFTGATALSLNGIFNGTYRNYRIVIQQNTSALGNLLLRVRNSGTDNATANYSWGAIGSRMSTTSTVKQSNNSNATSASIADMSGSTVRVLTTLDVTNMYDSLSKTYTSIGISADATSAYSLAGSGIIGVATPVDGFTIYTSAGNTTGSIQVFGYND